MLLTVLVVGLVVSIFQAATQIHEATLSFVPKIDRRGRGAGDRRAVDADHAGRVPAAHAAVDPRRRSARPTVTAVLTFTEAQVLAWVTPLLWPFLRVLALFSALPVLGQRSVPMRVRIGARVPDRALRAGARCRRCRVIALDSPAALLLVVQQVLIGVSLGFAVRIVFAAVEFAGELIGLQMGLNFAGFFDPMTGGADDRDEPLLRHHRWRGCSSSSTATCCVIAAVVQSFHAFPVGAEPFAFLRTRAAAGAGAPRCSASACGSRCRWSAMLLFVNLVLGVISRVAQQMNIFAIGFPITLGVGLVGVLLTLPMMQAPFTMALERMLAYFQ